MRSVVVGLVASVLVGTAAGTAAPAGATAPPITRVDPVDLHPGAAPRIPWIRDHSTLVKPPKPRAIDLGRLMPDHLFHVQGGYVLQLPTDGQTHDLRFVGYGGQQRTLAEGLRSAPVTASADGRWLVLSSDPYATGYTQEQRLQVIRVSDGRSVAARNFPRLSTVLAAGQGRVLVRQSNGATVSWSPARHTVRVLARTSARGGPRTTIAPPASFGAHRLVARDGDHDQMRDLRGSRRLWSTASGEFVVSFSPDDRRVVTAADVDGVDQEAPWSIAHVLRVRDARTGAVVRVFRGYFGIDRDDNPVWEDARTLLLHATGAWVPGEGDDEGHFAKPRIVRCAVATGACRIVRTGVVGVRPVLMVRKSN